MLDQYYTTIWDSNIYHAFAVRRGSVAGSIVTIEQKKHDLITGDVISVAARPGAEPFAIASAPITAINENSFTYVLPVAPNIPFPSVVVGQDVKIFVGCKKYSREMNYPRRVRVRQLTAGTSVMVQTKANLDGKTWLNQKELTSADGEVNLVFSPQFKEARLKLLTGIAPTVIAVHETAQELTPTADNVYPIPYLDPNANELPDVGVPGTYDIVTTNAKGQVISGIPVSYASNSIYKPFTNADTVPLLKGMPVRKVSSTGVAYAQGSTGKYEIVGLAAANIPVGQQGLIILEGVLAATASEWQLVTGVAGGLNTAGSRYFLNFSTSGLQYSVNTATAPSPSYLVAVGYAISGTEFKLEIEDPIQI